MVVIKLQLCDNKLNLKEHFTLTQLAFFVNNNEQLTNGVDSLTSALYSTYDLLTYLLTYIYIFVMKSYTRYNRKQTNKKPNY